MHSSLLTPSLTTGKNPRSPLVFSSSPLPYDGETSSHGVGGLTPPRASAEHRLRVRGLRAVLLYLLLLYSTSKSLILYGMAGAGQLGASSEHSFIVCAL
jgi:hypothetical protein